MPRTVRHGDRAQVFSLTAVIMVAMVGAMAIVIDVGIFFVVQRQFQTAADAGALSGAWHDPVCPAVAFIMGCDSSQTATQVAEEVAEANAAAMAGLCGGHAPVATVTTGTTLNLPARVNAIVVTVECEAGYSFGRILGLNTARISASSAAAIGLRQNPSREMGDFPVVVTDCQFGAPPKPPGPCLIARLIE